MFIAPPSDVDYDKRWDVLLAMISEERGWAEPGEREFPESDDSHCWPMPYTPAESDVPGTLREELLTGQAVVVEAVWTFGRPAKAVKPRIRAAAGWLPAVQVVAGRIPNLRDEVFLPLSTIAEGELPVSTTAEQAFEGGIQVMYEYDDLLARSALAGVQFLWADSGTISSAATEVTEGALACAELSSWEDLEFIEALARQELREAVEIRRSYVWFFARPTDDVLSHVPGPTRLDLIEEALELLDVPRTRQEVTRLPLRSLTLFEDAVPARELDELQHSVNDSWRSYDSYGISRPDTAQHQAEDGSQMTENHQEVLDVARLFTAATEKAMATTKLGHTSNSAERHRARHEAIAQYLLDHILQQEGELRRLLEELDMRIDHEPVLYNEWEDRETGSRFDHVIDDRLSETEYRSVVVIEDKIDAHLAPDQLDRYCEFLAGAGTQATVLVLHPLRNPLTAEKNRVPELQARHEGVTVRFMTWSALSRVMIGANPNGENVALWQALTEYAESVGTGDLGRLPAADFLTDPAVAAEVHDLFLTMQNVAVNMGRGRSRQLRFSFHGGNPKPWLQMAMSDSKHASVGLELDLTHSPGTLLAGVRGPEDPDGF